MGGDIVFKVMYEEFYTETCKMKEGKKKEKLKENGYFSLLN